MKFVLIALLATAVLSEHIWMGWTPRESGSAGYRQTNGDNGNAFGKYQFDRRYGLVPFMQWCYDYNSSRYSGFKKFINMGAGAAELQGNTELAALWVSYCDNYPEEFGKLQDVNAYNAYYTEITKYLKNLYGFHLVTKSPAVKGTAFSMAIRSGSLCAAYKFEGLSDSSDEKAILNQVYATYGTADANRWTKAGQWGDALKAYDDWTYTDFPTSM